MSREAFIDTKFRNATLAVIEQANAIIAEYEAQGFTLTLRQLYYQFVARDLIENRQSEYKRLGGIIKDARRAGLIDWAAIEDRTREVHTHSSWDSPACIIDAVARQYREDPWRDQHYRPEVWIEKDALLGDAQEGACGFTVPSPDGPIGLNPMPRFVSTKGGGYFFLPGRRLIDYLIDPF